MARISGVNIPTNKKVNIALTYIFGIGKKIALDICNNASIDISKRVSELNEQDVNNIRVKCKISSNEKNILLGIGGSGDTKRIPSSTFLKFMNYCSEKYKCRFFLATGKIKEEQDILNEIYNSKFKSQCLKLDDLRLDETLPYIKNCDISICNDSSFSHISAALGLQTIVLMADTPIIYGSYSPKMHPIIPEGVNEVGHNTLGKNKISALEIYKKFETLIN